MIMPRGDQLLLPLNPLFLWFSLVVALLLNMLPLGRIAWMPDFLALALVFWSIHQPRRVGVGTAFAFGLLMDVHQAALLGQHALAYTALAFLAIMIHRRVLWFPIASQAIQVLPLFAGAHALELLVRMIGGGYFPGWSLALAPVIEMLLWPVAAWVLLAPQRRPPERDDHRPL
jgi:rod shape-determining protein MreD